MPLEFGYYWIKLKSEYHPGWIIGQYGEYGWRIIPTDRFYQDDEIQEIGKQIIYI